MIIFLELPFRERRVLVRSYFAAFLTLPFTAMMATLAILSSFVSRKHLPTVVMQSWAKGLLVLFGVRLHLQGLEHVDNSKPTIFMANHASPVDIPVLIAALNVDLRFIFKQSILFLPFIGIAIWMMGMVPINRANKQKAARSLKKAGQQIRKGKHILIFPEGTRTRDGKLLPFKKGGFYLSIQESIDIVPISINGSRALCGRNSMLARSGDIEIKIHPRISTQDVGIEQRHNLIAEVRKTILSELKAPYL